MMSRSEKPVVLVTGATQYTGLTVAKLFAKRGYNVVVTSRSVEKLKVLLNRFVRKRRMQKCSLLG